MMQASSIRGMWSIWGWMAHRNTSLGGRRDDRDVLASWQEKVHGWSGRASTTTCFRNIGGVGCLHSHSWMARIGPVSGTGVIVGVPSGGVMERLITELVGEDAADEVGLSRRLEGTGDNGAGTSG